MAKKLPCPSGLLWPSELIYRLASSDVPSSSETYVFSEVAMPAGATRGTDSGSGRGSGWARLDVNREDPVEMTLAADLQKSALSHVAESSCGKYTCQFNMFVTWCEALAKPRVPLLASEATVAMYLQSDMNDAKTFAPMKAASAVIALY